MPQLLSPEAMRPIQPEWLPQENPTNPAAHDDSNNFELAVLAMQDYYRADNKKPQTINHNHNIDINVNSINNNHQPKTINNNIKTINNNTKTKAINNNTNVNSINVNIHIRIRCDKGARAFDPGPSAVQDHTWHHR